MHYTRALSRKKGRAAKFVQILFKPTSKQRCVPLSITKILKMKQAICLKNLFRRKDLLVILLVMVLVGWILVQFGINLHLRAEVALPEAAGRISAFCICQNSGLWLVERQLEIF